MPKSLTTASLFGELAHKVPASLAVTLLPTTAVPEATLVGSSPARQFVESVRRDGVVVPVLIKECATGAIHFNGARYSLVEGNRRLMAAHTVGLDVVPAMVLPAVDDSTTERLRLSLNGLRTDNPAAEYLAIKALLAGGLSESEIARQTGFVAPKIRARLALGDLHATLFAALADHKITAAVAESAAKLSPELQERLVASFEGSGKLSANEVRSIRQVEVAAALAELPYAVFEPAATDPDAWRAIVRADLERALAGVPGVGASAAGAKEVARAIKRALSFVDVAADKADERAA